MLTKCLYSLLAAQTEYHLSVDNPSLVKPSPDTSLPFLDVICPLIMLSSLHLSTSHFPNHPSLLSTPLGFPPMWSLPVFLNLHPFHLVSHPGHHTAIKELSEKPSKLVCLPCCLHLPKIPTTEPQLHVLHLALQRKAEIQDGVGCQCFPAHF